MSIDEKLRKIPFPRTLRPHPMMGKILDDNASTEERETARERTLQLLSIKLDYVEANLVNSILTVALAVYLLAINVIPFVIGAILIAGFSLTAAVIVYALNADYSIKRFEKKGAANV